MKLTVVGLTLFAFCTGALAQNNPPSTITLQAKLRDFKESPDLGKVVAGHHPHFNACASTGLAAGNIETQINVNGQSDPRFEGDNRNPKLKVPLNSNACLTPVERFEDWFNDKSSDINRAFLTELQFVRNDVTGMYEYGNSAYFPLNNGKLNQAGGYTKFDPSDPNPFGHLQSGIVNNIDLSSRNYGFTLEMHTSFAYHAGEGQTFLFRGDDDVWVFINDKLVIDLGGIHSALERVVNLDNLAAQLGLVDGENYPLDFFFAERRVTQSNLFITTSLALAQPSIVDNITASPPGHTFPIQTQVTLSTPTPEVTIRYTIDGSTPDSTSTIYTGPLTFIETTILKAIAYKAGWLPSEVLTETYTKVAPKSSLQILNATGQPFASGYLTQNDNAFTVQVTTYQAGLTSISPTSATQIKGDNLTLTLSNPVIGNTIVYTGTVPFKSSDDPVSIANTLEAAFYDTVTVTWVNPSDPTDIATAKMPVRAAPKQATAYFSTNPQGTDTTDTYVGTEAFLYIIIDDQILPPGAGQVTLTTTPFLGGQPDNLILPLTPVAGTPGRYSATIPTDLLNPVNTADGLLQLALQDEIKATYQDPTSPTEPPAIANAGFGIKPEITAQFEFTDANYVPLPPGIHWSPTEGFIYLRYRDDVFDGSITTKQLNVVVTNNQGKAKGDEEKSTLVLTLNPGATQQSTGFWFGKFPLKDLPNPGLENSIVETYILGEVTVSVPTHNKLGTAGPNITTQLRVAYPDENEVLALVNTADPVAEIERATNSITVIIKDQTYSSVQDTIFADMSCTNSGDILRNVRLIESDTQPGTYTSAPVAKNEGSVDTGDLVLTCKDTDEIKLQYTDQVYGNIREIVVPFGGQSVNLKLYYTEKDKTQPISFIRVSQGNSFMAWVEGHSPRVNQIDTIAISFTTEQGENETFYAVETGPFTQLFKVEVPFAFVDGKPTVNNKIIDAQLVSQTSLGRVVVTGKVTHNGVTREATIVLQSEFILATTAYIKDENGNGRGDKVYIVFESPLAELPAQLDSVYWNEAKKEFVQVAGKSRLSFLEGSNNTVVVADFTDSEFGENLTSIPAGANPYVLLPDNLVFLGQKVAIADSIGPVIITAVKKPADLTNPNSSNPEFNLDTLVVKLSEPITTQTDWNELLRFSTDCKDYTNSFVIKPNGDPVFGDGGTTVTIVINNADGKSPQPGNCLFLNTDGRYTDKVGNIPPEKGVKITGEPAKLILQGLRGFPPVAGMDPSKNPDKFIFAINEKISDTENPKGYTVKDGDSRVVNWIPPVEWQKNSTFRPFIPDKVTDGSQGGDNTGIQPMPVNEVSAVQVITTGKYIAHINLFDHLGNFVKSWSQAFGYRGELANRDRIVPKGLVSYLVWDMKDHRGQRAGQGAYVWKVIFTFESNKQEVRYIRTGVLRSDD